MTIQSYATLEEAQAVAEPTVIVSYDGTYVVYSDTDLETPPTNPAQGE